MSKEILDAIKKSLLLPIKTNFNSSDIEMFDYTIEEILNSKRMKSIEKSYYLDGYQHIVRYREYNRGFLSRLLYDYHIPITHLEIFCENCLGIGKEFLDKNRKKQSPLQEALLRLHGRAVLISSEILCLIKNGFASGAFARWRTLFEISVFAIFIAKNGEEIAKRYLDHIKVETIKEQNNYIKYSKELDYEEIEQEVIDANLKIKIELEHKYGKDFLKGDYAWAKPAFNSDVRITFKKILENTDQESIYLHYAFACNYIHAGAKGLYYDIGMLNGLNEELLPTQTNIGFTDPAQLLAYSLLNTTSAFISLNPTPSDLLHILFLKNKVIEIANEFMEVENELGERNVSSICY